MWNFYFVVPLLLVLSPKNVTLTEHSSATKSIKRTIAISWGSTETRHFEGWHGRIHNYPATRWFRASGAKWNDRRTLVMWGWRITGTISRGGSRKSEFNFVESSGRHSISEDWAGKTSEWIRPAGTIEAKGNNRRLSDLLAAEIWAWSRSRRMSARIAGVGCEIERNGTELAP